MKYIIYSLKNGFNFSGRASAAEYGLFILTFNIFFYVIVINLEDLNPLLLSILCLMLLYGIIAALSVSVRRLHDMNKSGWFVLLVNIFFPLSLLFMFFKSYEAKNNWGNLPNYE